MVLRANLRQLIENNIEKNFLLRFYALLASHNNFLNFADYFLRVVKNTARAVKNTARRPVEVSK